MPCVAYHQPDMGKTIRNRTFLTKTGNELQGKASQNEIATKNNHKCDVLILHLFPTLFQVLHDLGAFTLHRKTANPSTKTNKPKSRLASRNFIERSKIKTQHMRYKTLKQEYDARPYHQQHNRSATRATKGRASADQQNHVVD